MKREINKNLLEKEWKTEAKKNYNFILLKRRKILKQEKMKKILK